MKPTLDIYEQSESGCRGGQGRSAREISGGAAGIFAATMLALAFGLGIVLRAYFPGISRFSLAIAALIVVIGTAWLLITEK